MGKECGNFGMERGEELNLELSIGFGKTENCKEEIGKLFQDNNVSENSRSNLAENDLQRRREIQALRRQEARRKREEKIKKSRGGQNGVFVENKLLLEAQKLQGRVEERESRERYCDSEERGRKKCSNEVGGGELSLSLFTDNKTERRDCLVQRVNASQYSFPYWAYSSADYDSEQSNGVNDPGNGNTTSNRSLEQCSSAVSDYHSISHKGGSSSDTAGSHSSPMRLHLSISRTLESHDSWSQPETNRARGGAKSSALSNTHSNLRRPENSYHQPNNTTETSGSLIDKSTTNNNLNATASIPKMPCVSATGNGPNGRTITGFLYRYTKTEVSIMCVCHGSSFSPAGFVEHAGGIDISHPLKHITIVPR